MNVIFYSSNNFDYIPANSTIFGSAIYGKSNSFRKVKLIFIVFNQKPVKFVI